MINSLHVHVCVLEREFVNPQSHTCEPIGICVRETEIKCVCMRESMKIECGCGRMLEQTSESECDREYVRVW